MFICVLLYGLHHFCLIRVDAARHCHTGVLAHLEKGKRDGESAASQVFLSDSNSMRLRMTALLKDQVHYNSNKSLLSIWEGLDLVVTRMLLAIQRLTQHGTFCHRTQTRVRLVIVLCRREWLQCLYHVYASQWKLMLIEYARNWPKYDANTVRVRWRSTHLDRERIYYNASNILMR